MSRIVHHKDGNPGSIDPANLEIQMFCDLCGERMNPDRDAITKLGLEPLVIDGKAAKNAHLGCYRLNRHFLDQGINPNDVNVPHLEGSR